MIDHDTREYIEMRAEQSNIDLAKLNIEFDQPFDGVASTWQVTVIFDGVLDSEFYITGPYEINVADWIADFFETTQPEAEWRIDVYELILGSEPDEEPVIGDCIYRLTETGPAIFCAVNDGSLENPK